MLLALDLSTVKTGFAFGGESDHSPRTGVWSLPGADESVFDQTLARLADSVSSLAAMIKPKHVFIEAPLVIMDRSAHTMVALMQLTGAARSAATRAGGKVALIASQTVRRHFVGSSRPENPKQVVMERCRLLGWSVQDDNAADAAATWCYGMSLKFPKWSPQGTPLFAARSGV